MRAMVAAALMMRAGLAQAYEAGDMVFRGGVATVSLQYVPTYPSGAFQPYVGAGINYTLFFDEDVDGQLEGVLGSGDLDLDASFGLALQAGFDYALSDKWLVNAGVWWVDIDTDATFTFGSSQLTTDVEIDPFVDSISLGYRF
ncbi:MAG: OmpW family outer membrane protein [Pseudomonadota bacterium]